MRDQQAVMCRLLLSLLPLPLPLQLLALLLLPVVAVLLLWRCRNVREWAHGHGSLAGSRDR
jgi:membrane protein implicated in regulation of membrane protease activity